MIAAVLQQKEQRQWYIQQLAVNRIMRGTL